MNRFSRKTGENGLIKQNNNNPAKENILRSGGINPGRIFRMKGNDMTAQEKRYGSWAEDLPVITEEQCTRTLRTEVLVIGAGIAGMTCAYSASECGAKVTVLEKTAGYSARGFNIGAANSSFMAEKGYFNDIDAVMREWVKRCANRCDERLVRLFLEKGPEAVDWLMELITRPEYKVRPELNFSRYRGETYEERMGAHIFFDGPVARTGKFGGMNDVLEPMFCEMKKAGVEFLFETPMLCLLKEDGTVTGAVAETKEGERIAVKAEKGVVLATGGIGGNREMCADLAPTALQCPVNLDWHNGASNGDGHRAAMQAGGELEDGPFPVMMHPQAFWHSSFAFLFVDDHGNRYMNEDTYLQARAQAILRIGQQFAWSVFDSAWAEKVPQTLPYGGGLFWGQDVAVTEEGYAEQEEWEKKKLEQGMKAGMTVTADTPRELAEKMGIDADSFVRTFERYNRMCAEGKDTEFGKRPELMIPIDRPPYYARKFGPALLSVVGGVRVDTQMRVLDHGRNPIPGLYAIGNTAGGRYGVDYPTLILGNSHGMAVTFGYLLGRQLA